MTFRLLLLVATAGGASCASPWAALTPEPPIFAGRLGDVGTESRRLASFPADVNILRFEVADLGKGWACIVEKEGSTFLVHNGAWSEPIERLHVILLSADGKRCAYQAGERFFVGGRAWASDGITWVTPNPQVTRFAARGIRGLKEFMVVDGVQSEEFDYVSWPSFNADGTSVAYCARSGNRQWVVLDGRKLAEYEPYDRTSLIGRSNAPPGDKGPRKDMVDLPVPAFSADGSSLAYPARRAGSEFVVLDHREGEAFAEVEPPIWSPRGKRLAYVASRDGKSCAVLDGKRGPWFDRVYATNFERKPTFSADGSTLGYLARRGSAQVLAIEGRAEIEFPYAEVDGLALSPGGRNWAFIAGTAASRRGKGWLEKSFVVTNEGPGPVWRSITIGDVTFAPGGVRFAYEADTGPGDSYHPRVIVDHHPQEHFRPAWRSSFSPNGRHVLHLIGDQSSTNVVVDTTPGEPFDEIHFTDLTFSPDSTHVGFSARRGRELWWNVVELK